MKNLNLRWEELCTDFNADFIDDIQCNNGKIEAKVGKWWITLDTTVISSGMVSVDLTRMRARYKRLDNFNFHIYPKTSFNKFIDYIKKSHKTFNLEHPGFENDFIIGSNDKHKIENLLSNQKIMQIIKSQPFMIFEIIGDEERLGKEKASDMSEISIKVAGVINDPNRIKCLFELFSEVLNELCLLKTAI